MSASVIVANVMPAERHRKRWGSCGAGSRLGAWAFRWPQRRQHLLRYLEQIAEFSGAAKPLAAVERHDLAAHPIGCVRDEERGELGKLLGSAEPPGGDPLLACGFQLGGRQQSRERTLRRR